MWKGRKIVKSRYGERRKYAISIGKIRRGKHRGVPAYNHVSRFVPESKTKLKQLEYAS